MRYLAENKQHVLNTYYRHKPVQSFSWYSNDGRTRKILDLCLCSSFLVRDSLDCRVRRSYDFHSDHRLVVCRFRTGKKRTDRKTVKRSPKITKIDFKAIDDHHKSRFTEQLENNSPSVAPTVENLIEILQNASEALPKASKSTRKKYPWDTDSELIELLAA